MGKPRVGNEETLMETETECDHDWELQDDSFDHEFGTEKVVYWLCLCCDKTKDIQQGDFEYE